MRPPLIRGGIIVPTLPMKKIFEANAYRDFF
jgi:hypothetical protein